mgnify:FL=1
MRLEVGIELIEEGSKWRDGDEFQKEGSNLLHGRNRAHTVTLVRACFKSTEIKAYKSQRKTRARMKWLNSYLQN